MDEPIAVVMGDAGSGRMLCAHAALSQLGLALFDPAHEGVAAQPVEAGGRQAAWFVQADTWQGVLRHYRRGGLVARFNRAHYLWTGENRTRSFKEYRLLAVLRRSGLRVPAPLAAAYWRHGLCYRAAIVVERIPAVQPLAHRLTEPLWEAVATAIVRMHQVGVWHADLNAFNILVDAENQVWLIDFDRSTQGALSERQRVGNLARLRRSLNKVGGEVGEHFWLKLRDAYWACWDMNRHP